MKTFAVDIGGTKFSLAAFDGDRLLLRESRSTDRGGGPDWMFSQIQEIFSLWREKEAFQPDRCGIGFGGPVDFPSQTVTLSTHVEGWPQYPLAQNIAAFTGVPTVMDNDANVGALGEAMYGAGRQLPYLFYMTLSTGIGGGIVLNESVYRGADSFAGEIGHLNIVPDGPECLCGSHGCLERMCCGLWLQRDYGRSAEELMYDPEFVRIYVVYLARGLKAALMLLNPSCIVIGGGISKAGDRLFGPLTQELNRQMTQWSRARRNVVPAQLGDNSVLYGALALAQTITPKINKI
ncbi:MAG: ROK family protein [Acidobacteriaceae bacterium]|nr:ROK family protein [Acidobacteriaceae bacterium]MBV9306143.1 ROK family protein [Acidobacteriaceae bacterium]